MAKYRRRALERVRLAREQYEQLPIPNHLKRGYHRPGSQKRGAWRPSRAAAKSVTRR